MNLLHLIRKNGFFYLVEQVWHRVVPSSVFRFAVMNVYAVDRENLGSVKRNKNIVCQVADDAATMAALREVTYMAVPDERVAGHAGYLASIRDSNAGEEPKVAGGVWAGIGDYYEEDFGIKLKLNESQAWIYCALVNKSARGAGVYSNAFCFAIDDLARRGHDQVLLSVTPWNKKSQRAHKQLVGRQVGRISAARFFRWGMVLTSGCAERSRTFTENVCSKPIDVKLTSASQ